MVGLEDGMQDALFRFTRPVTGNLFGCPSWVGDRLDLRGRVLSPSEIPRTAKSRASRAVWCTPQG